jgi:hypothetical protein
MPKIGGFLKADTAGLPNWVWLGVIAAGVGVAYFLPKFMGTKQADQASTGTGTDASGLGLAIDPTTGLPYAVEGLVPSGAGAGAGVNQGPQGPQGVPGPPGPTGPGGPPIVPPNKNPRQPILPWNFKGLPKIGGAIFTYQGQTYTIVPGTKGVIWGAIGRMSYDEAKAKPIGAGSKIMLLAPQNYMVPGALAPSIEWGQMTPRYESVPAWPDAGSSLGDIARRNGVSLARLEALNPSLTDPEKLFPGERVRVA